MKILEIDENGKKDKIKLEIEKTDEILKLNIRSEEEDDYKNLDSPFYNVEIDLENLELKNCKDIIAKWDMKYKENIMYGNMEDSELAVSLDPYFREKKSLEFIIINYLYIPFILILFRKEKEIKKIKFYDILNIKELEFDITKNIKEEKERKEETITGKISSNFDFVEIKSKLREELDIKPSELFNPEITFEGEAEYFGKEIKSFKYEVRIKDRNEKLNRYLYIEWNDKNGD